MENTTQIENEMFLEMTLTGFGFDHTIVMEPNYDFYNN